MASTSFRLRMLREQFCSIVNRYGISSKMGFGFPPRSSIDGTEAEYDFGDDARGGASFANFTLPSIQEVSGFVLICFRFDEVVTVEIDR